MIRVDRRLLFRPLRQYLNFVTEPPDLLTFFDICLNLKPDYGGGVRLGKAQRSDSERAKPSPHISWAHTAMSAHFSSGPATDHEICNVYHCADFVVTSGVNSGDNVTNAAMSNLGDTYMFSQHARAFDLVVDDRGAGHPSKPFDDTARDQHVGAGSHAGTLGHGLELESRLTLIGSDGSKAEVLVINNTTAGDGHGAVEYFLPMTPLTPDIDYTLIKADTDPGEFRYADYKCVCFARGTLIRLADGCEKRIEDLVSGDMVETQDHGAQPVRWVGGRTARAFGHLAPVVITTGALGNHSDLIVSQQHRILLSDWRAEVMLGSLEVLVRAKDLVNGETIYVRQGGVVEYFHILFDNHEIIFAEGIATESLHINRSTLDSLADESRAEILELFPELDEGNPISIVASRMSLKSYEATALLKQVGFS